MTPAEMLHAADMLLSREAWLSVTVEEVKALAAKLRALAITEEFRQQTKPRLPVEKCPHCGGTGWQD